MTLKGDILKKTWIFTFFLGIVLSTSASEVEMTISTENVIHPQDTGHVFVDISNMGDEKEFYIRAFSSALDIQDRERRIRLEPHGKTVVVFDYTVKDTKAGFYDLSVVYSYEYSVKENYPDKTTRTYLKAKNGVEHFVQRLERPTTIKLLEDKINLESAQKTRLTFVSDGDVRFVKYTINYDSNLLDIKYDGSLQNFSGTKEEEITIEPKKEGNYAAEIEIFFVDALGEFHNEKIPLTISAGEDTLAKNGILVILAAAVIAIAGRFVLSNGKARHKV